MKWLNERGQTIVEVLVAIGLAGLLMPAILTAFVATRDGRASDAQRLQATGLLREANEAVRAVKLRGWSAFAVNGTYHPEISGGAWSLVSGTETLGAYSRQIVISDVQRNTGGAIVASGGTTDPATKQVMITVSWTTPSPSSVTSTSYYSRYAGNTSQTQSGQSTFNTGTLTNTVVNSGNVQLVAPGAPSWVSPASTGTFNASGTDDATDVFVDSVNNYAYLADGTGFTIVNIANPAAPVQVGIYNAGAGINGIYVSGNYAYLASTNNTAELTIVNITNKAAPVLAGSLNLGDTVDASSVYVDGSYAYVGKLVSTTGGINEFYVVNVTTPTAPALSGSLNIAGNVNSVQVSGNYAYLATAVDTAELTIVNITNKAAPASAGVYNAAGTADALDVFVNGTTAYLGDTLNTSGAEFFIINAATPASPSLTGSYEANGNVNGVYVVGTQAFLATAVSSQEFMTLNISTPASPALLGSANLGSPSTDISATSSYAYLGSGENNAELKIVGPTNTPYQTLGTYESPSFDAGGVAAFNYFTWSATVPANTTITFQIAVNSDNATWNYVGPDGTAGTSYSAGGPVPMVAVSGQYLRYRATLTSNGSDTPSLISAAINYSL